MRSLLRGKRVYIDTNVYIYVALKHPEFYEKCYEVLRLLAAKEFTGYGSSLVLHELFGALSEVSAEAAYEAATAYLDLPLTMLEPSRRTLSYAKTIARLAHVTYDALHAALAAENGVEVIVTEDVKDWRKVLRAWPKVREEHRELGDLIVVSPTRGLIEG